MYLYFAWLDELHRVIPNPHENVGNEHNPTDDRCDDSYLWSNSAGNMADKSTHNTSTGVVYMQHRLYSCVPEPVHVVWPLLHIPFPQPRLDSCVSLWLHSLRSVTTEHRGGERLWRGEWPQTRSHDQRVWCQQLIHYEFPPTSLPNPTLGTIECVLKVTILPWRNWLSPRMTQGQTLKLSCSKRNEPRIVKPFVCTCLSMCCVVPTMPWQLNCSIWL